MNVVVVVVATRGNGLAMDLLVRAGSLREGRYNVRVQGLALASRLS